MSTRNDNPGWQKIELTTTKTCCQRNAAPFKFLIDSNCINFKNIHRRKVLYIDFELSRIPGRINSWDLVEIQFADSEDQVLDVSMHGLDSLGPLRKSDPKDSKKWRQITNSFRSSPVTALSSWQTRPTTLALLKKSPYLSQDLSPVSSFSSVN